MHGCMCMCVEGGLFHTCTHVCVCVCGGGAGPILCMHVCVCVCVCVRVHIFF